MTTNELTREALAPLSLPPCHYAVDVSWRYLPDHIEREREVGFDLLPAYQRGRVWTREQQVAYIEHIALGGETAREVTAVHVGKSVHDYVDNGDGTISLSGYSMLDGVQRVSAILAFVRDEFPVLTRIRPEGYLWSQFSPGLRRSISLGVRWRVVTVPTAADVLKLYLRFNAAGTPHTPEELDRVRAMLAAKGGAP